MELHNKTALVTGAGATGGIGLEIAKLLTERGATVVVSGRDPDRGVQAVGTLDGEVRFVRADLTSIDDVRALAAEAGAVDILVNNAAAHAVCPTLDQDVESFDAMLATNIRGPYFLTAALAPGMAERGAGSIVNVSTASAGLSAPAMSVYAATKAAVESLTRTWAAEFAGSGIRVNAVAPGVTRSEKVMSTAGPVAEAMAQGSLLKRTAYVSEIAEAVLFLASDRASFITGACLPVDGGRTVA